MTGPLEVGHAILALAHPNGRWQVGIVRAFDGHTVTWNPPGDSGQDHVAGTSAVRTLDGGTVVQVRSATGWFWARARGTRADGMVLVDPGTVGQALARLWVHAGDVRPAADAVPAPNTPVRLRTGPARLRGTVRAWSEAGASVYGYDASFPPPVLVSPDAGQGVSGSVVVPVTMVEVDAQTAADAAPAAEEPDTNPDLVAALRTLGDRFGPLGVALVAARLTDPVLLIQRLTTPTTSAQPQDEPQPERAPAPVFPMVGTGAWEANLETIEDAAVELPAAEGQEQRVVLPRSHYRWLRGQVERVHSWDGLMEVLDEHYPVSVFNPEASAEGDPGPRILALTRALDAERREVARLRGWYEREQSRADLLNRELGREMMRSTKAETTVQGMAEALGLDPDREDLPEAARTLARGWGQPRDVHRWLGHEVEAFNASDPSKVVTRGTVVTVADFPTVLIVDGEGNHTRWGAHLIRPWPDTETNPDPMTWTSAEWAQWLTDTPPPATADRTTLHLVFDGDHVRTRLLAGHLDETAATEHARNVDGIVAAVPVVGDYRRTRHGQK